MGGLAQQVGLCNNATKNIRNINSNSNTIIRALVVKEKVCVRKINYLSMGGVSQREGLCNNTTQNIRNNNSSTSNSNINSNKIIRVLVETEKVWV